MDEREQELERLEREMRESGMGGGRPGPCVPARMTWNGHAVVRMVGETKAEDGDFYLEYLGEQDRTWHKQDVWDGQWPCGVSADRIHKGYLYRRQDGLHRSGFPYEVADQDLVLEHHARALPEPVRVIEEPEFAAESFRGIDRSQGLGPWAKRVVAAGRRTEARGREEGQPSAALAAKPAEPRGAQVYCQGDWYDDLENL